MKLVPLFCLAGALVSAPVNAAVLLSDDFSNTISSNRLTNDAFAGGSAPSSYWATAASVAGTSLKSNQAPGSSLQFFETGAAGTNPIDQFYHDSIDATHDIFGAGGGLKYAVRGMATSVQLGSTTSGSILSQMDFGVLSHSSTLTSSNDKVALRLRSTINQATPGSTVYTFVVGQTQNAASGSGGDVFAGKTYTTLDFMPTGFDFDITPTGYALTFFNGGETVGLSTSGTFATAMTAANWGNGTTTTGSLLRIQQSRVAGGGASAAADSSAGLTLGSIVVSDVPEPTSLALVAVGAGAMLRRRRA